MNRFIFIFGLIILVFLASVSFAGIPKMINYQGMLTGSDGKTPVNNGNYAILFSVYNTSSGGGSLWSHTYNVGVTNGLFNVILGDSGVPINLPFDTTYWLGIKVGADLELSPRTQLTSVGYAYRARVADSAVVSPPPSTGGGWTDDGTVVRLTTSSDNVGIGTTSPGGKLHVASSTSNFGMLKIENSNTGDNEATIGFKEGSDAGGADIWVAGVGPWGNTNDFVIGRGESKFLMTPDGNVGIGTTNPLYKLHVKGSSSATYLTVEAPGGYAPGINFNVAGSEQWTILYHPTYSYLSFYKDGVGDKMIIKDNGNVGIGTTSPSNKLHIFGSNPRLIIEASSSNAEINFKNYDDTGGEVWALYKDAGTDDFRFYQNGDKVTIKNSTGNVGIGTTNPSRRLTVRGNILIESASTGNPVVELGEGLDYAEGFDVSDKREIGPGAVLVIDPDNPGKLALSNKAYDSKVAGIVAGAKGLGSGVRLGVGEFDYNVALAGRVYCNVDATYGEVSPGDLLTTSPTPGYAMVVKDHTKAQGAILGKAMEKLTSGEKRQILVLVTLQ